MSTEQNSIMKAIDNGEVTGTIDINTNPPREIKAIAKRISDLPACEVGKVVVLQSFKQTVTGTFRGMDDDDETIMLKGLTSGTTMGFSIQAFRYYWEEIKEG